MKKTTAKSCLLVIVEHKKRDNMKNFQSKWKKIYLKGSGEEKMVRKVCA